MHDTRAAARGRSPASRAVHHPAGAVDDTTRRLDACDTARRRLADAGRGLSNAWAGGDQRGRLLLPGNGLRARLQPGRRDVSLERWDRRSRRLDRDGRGQRWSGLRRGARLRREPEPERSREQRTRRCGREPATVAIDARGPGAAHAAAGVPAGPAVLRRWGVSMRCRSSQRGYPPIRRRCCAGSRRRRSDYWPSRCSRSRPSARRGCGRPSSGSRGCWSSPRPTLR